MVRQHCVKSWPEFFGPIADGTSAFDLRRNDRKYAVGDTLTLKEFEPAREHRGGPYGYTGRKITRRVTSVLDGVGPGAIAPLEGLHRGFCILATSASKRGSKPYSAA